MQGTGFLRGHTRLKNLSSLILCSVAASGLLGQNDNKVEYKVVTNDASNVAHTILAVTPAQLVMDGSFDANLRLGGFLNFGITEKLSLQGQFDYQYPGVSASSIIGAEVMNTWTGDVMYEYDFENTYSGDIGLTFTVSDKTRDQEMPVPLQSQQSNAGNLSIISTNYIMFTGEYRKIGKVRAGYLVNKTNWYSNFISPNALLRTEDGSEFTQEGVKYSDVDYSQFNDAFRNNELSEVLFSVVIPSKVQAVYLGYSTTKITNVVLDVKEFGNRGRRSMVRTYYDLIIGQPQMGSFEFFASNPNSDTLTGTISNELRSFEVDTEGSSFGINNFGFRIGQRYHNPGFSKKTAWEDKADRVDRLLYWSLSWEAGLQPAFGFVQGLYGKLGISLELHPEW